jgi:hypothetical protein
MKKLLLALALLLAPTLASAQCNGVFPNNTVCGNVTGASNLPRPTTPSAFLGAAGGTNGQVQFNNGGALGGLPIVANGIIGSLNGTTETNLVLPTCSAVGQSLQYTLGVGFSCVAAGAVGSSIVFTSRAVAAAQNLTSFTTIKTLGYAASGDGGGATFVKVSGIPFKDTYVTTGTIAGGSAYTNGTYLGVRMTGGSGQGCIAKVTIAGGAMTAVDLSGNYCNAYAVGNVLTPVQSDVGGTGTGATFTVTAITTPTGSFTDTAANQWQIVVDEGNFLNARQFGAKIDWAGTDGTATNDLTSMKSGMAFMSTQNPSATAAVYGGTFIIPKGAMYLCASPPQFATLQVPNGVILKGAGVLGGTTLKQCTAAASSEHFISLCDPNSQFGQFGCRLEDLSLVMTGPSNSAIAAVYSNSGQQFPLLNNVYIQSTTRGCVFYEIGKGGASNAIFNSVDCEVSDTTVNPGFLGNSSSTQIVLRDWVFGCAPGNCAASVYAINMLNGNYIIQNFHIEGHVDGINVATTGTSSLSSIRNGTIVSGCVNGITLQATNPNNTVLVENIESSCSTATILNGHAAGVNVTGHIMKQVTCAGTCN